MGKEKVATGRGIDMEYELLADSDVLRRQFIEKFVMTRDAFAVFHRDFLEKQGLSAERYFEKCYLWDRIKPEVSALSFALALEKLKLMNRKVILISEGEGHPSDSFCKLEHYGKNKKGFAVEADAVSLASRLEYEWKEEYTEEHYLGKDKILPDDLYIFDRSFSWCLVFTHETQTDAPESRYCMSYGI